MGSGSGKQTVGYRYFLGMHMILCHGPIDYLRRIEVDSKRAYSGEIFEGRIEIDKPELFGGEKREGGVQGDVDFESGKPTQTPNDYLQSRLGSSIPAFRGVCGVVLRQVYLGVNPYLKRWSFRAQRIHTAEGGTVQWYDEKSEISYSAESVTITENFSKGLDAYEGVVSGFSIVDTGPNIFNPNPALQVSPTNDPDVSIEKPIEAEELFLTGCSVRFRITGTNSDDISSFTITDINDEEILKVHPRREASVDPLQRCQVNAHTGTSGNIISTEELNTNEWYRIEFITDSVNLSYDVNLYDEDDQLVGSLTDVAPNASDNFKAFKISFLKAGSSGGITWDDITITGLVIQRDMNPAHIIRECLTNSDWGMGYSSSDIDDTSFMSAADTLYTEEMGISLVWDRQTAIESFISEIVRHIDAALYVDRETGLFVLTLIRDDYDEGTLLVLDESNVAKVSSLSRPTFGELTNSVTVNYWESRTGENASVSVQDTALVLMQNATINTTLQYPGFTRSSIASRVALRDLKALSTPLWTGTIYANRIAKDFKIGSAFKFSWAEYGINEVVMRVTGIAYGDGKSNQIRIQATQDVFSIQNSSGVAAPDPDDGWVPLDTEPKASDPRIVVESPYYELVNLLTQLTADDKLADNPDLGYVVAAAGRPDVEAALNALLMVDSGGGYEESDTLDFAPYAFIDSDVLKSDIDVDGLVIVDITGATDIDEIELGTHAQINDEMFRVDAVSSSQVTLGRAILDTVPQDHSQGDAIIFWDEFPSSDEVEYVSSETVSVKILTNTGAGTLDESIAPADSVTLDSRAIRPYPPGNFEINSSYFPDVIGANSSTNLTWAHRDRLQQTSGNFEDFADGNIGPEAGTTYEVRIYGEEDDLIKTELGITTTSFTYLISDEIDDSEIPADGGLSGDFPDFINIAGLLAYWRLNETNGTTAADTSGNSEDATIFGAPTLDAGSMLFSGDGSSIDFVSPSQYITRAGASFSDLSEITVVAIVNTDSLSSRQRVIHKGSNVGGDRSLYSWDLNVQQTSGDCVWNVSNGSTFESITHSTSLSANTDYLLICGYDSSELFHHINGTTETSSRSTSGQNNETGLVCIAAEYDGGGIVDEFDGQIAEVAIFNRRLNSSEINNLYTTFSTGPILGSGFRQNGRLRILIESLRDGHRSFKSHNHEVRRPGYGFNYGYFYGNSA